MFMESLNKYNNIYEHEIRVKRSKHFPANRNIDRYKYLFQHLSCLTKKSTHTKSEMYNQREAIM